MSQLLKKVDYVKFTKGGIVTLALMVAAVGMASLELDLLGPIVAVYLGVAYLLFWIFRKSQSLTIYSDRVEVRSKFVTERIRRIEASKIESVDVRDTPLGQRKYGTVVVTGSGGSKILAMPVPNQHEIAELVRSISSASPKKVKEQNSASSGTHDDIASQIKKLDALRESGVLSQEEFKAAKAKLLGI
jgi:hypothetical protein